MYFSWLGERIDFLGQQLKSVDARKCAHAWKAYHADSALAFCPLDSLARAANTVM